VAVLRALALGAAEGLDDAGGPLEQPGLAQQHHQVQVGAGRPLVVVELVEAPDRVVEALGVRSGQLVESALPPGGVLVGLAKIHLPRDQTLERLLGVLQVAERGAPADVEERDQQRGEQCVDRGDQRGEVADRGRGLRDDRRSVGEYRGRAGRRRLGGPFGSGPFGGRGQDLRAAATRAAKRRRAGSEWPTSSSGCHCTPSTKRAGSPSSAPSTIWSGAQATAVSPRPSRLIAW
jgi:hypothetical protein